MFVAVLDTNKTPLSPCHPAVARQLLRDGKAAIYRKFPFVIILKREIPSEDIRSEALSLNIDPGDTTGLAIVADDKILWAAEMGSRKKDIVKKNKSRASLRRGRRSRKTRYRAPRFMNRNNQTLTFEDGVPKYESVKVTTPKSKTNYSRVPQHLLRDKRFTWRKLEKVKRKERREIVQLKNGETKIKIHRTSTRWTREHTGTGRNQSRRGKHGWIAPSIRSPLFNLVTWVNRLTRYFPITQIRFEKASFDIAKMLNQEISGIAYQQQTLYGEDVRSYVFRRDKHTCQYCNKKGIGKNENSVILTIDHVIPKKHGGTDVVTNLVAACVDCNGQRKRDLLPHEIRDKELKENVEKALKKAQKPMKAPTTMNILQTKRLEFLESFGAASNIPVEFGYGSHTKHFREVAGLPKEHYYDAACLNGSPHPIKGLRVLQIQPKGHGNRDLFNTEKGFPIRKTQNGNDARAVSHRDGFAKYDLVKCSYHVTTGKNKGQHRKEYGTITSFENQNPNEYRVSVHPDIAKTWNLKTNRVTLKLKALTWIQRRDGYAYNLKDAAVPGSPVLKKKETLTSLSPKNREIIGSQLYLF